MKHLLILFILVFAIACNDEGEGNSVKTCGFYSVTSNGKSWDSNVINTSFDDDPDTLRSIALLWANPYNTDNGEALRFNNIVLKPGKYPIDTMLYNAQEAKLCASFSTSIAFGEVGDHYWSPAQNSENYLVVESYNPTSGRLNASFQVYLVTDPSRKKFDPSLPDTLRYTKGKISVSLKK